MQYLSKRTEYSRTFFLVVAILDSLCLYFAFRVTFWRHTSTSSEWDGAYSSLYVVWMLVWVIAALLLDQYDTSTLKTARGIVRSTGKVVAVHLLCISIYLFIAPHYFDIQYLADNYVFSVLAVVGLRLLLLYGYQAVSNRRKNRVNFIIVGCTATSKKLLEYLLPSRKFGHQFFGFFDDAHLDERIVGRFSDVESFCQTHNINQVYFASTVDDSVLTKLTKYANDNYIRFAVVCDPTSSQYQERETSTYVSTLSYPGIPSHA